MRQMLHTLYDWLFQVGYDSQTIQRISPRIQRYNYHTMTFYCPLAIGMLVILSAGALVLPFMSAYLPCYLIALAGTTLSGVCLLMSRRHPVTLNVGIFVLIATLLLFGVFTGTVFDPKNPTATYVALIFVIPLLFCQRPVYTLFTLVVNDGLFVWLCFRYKDEAVIYSDLLNIIPFSILSFVVSLISTKNRLRQFLLEEKLTEAKELERQRNKELEHICSHDTMTEMGNYHLYLQLEQGFDIMSEDTATGVLFADLNRLKYINDHQGHEAGNDYITSFASRLKRAFPDCQCFRLSGDEFLVIGMGQEPTSFCARAAAFKAEINAEAIPVSAIGYLCEKSTRLATLTQAAEQKMYEDKLDFYERFPEFKR